MSDLWLLTYEAAPLPDNPDAQKSAGAYVNCWIKADSQAAAAEIATRGIATALWSIVELTKAKPVNPQVEQYPPTSMRMIEQAQIDGAVFVFNQWPVPAPKRRWTFSLRTLFVVVTLFACCLGYQLNWIRQRREVLAMPNVSEISDPFADGPSTSAPGLLWLFGEQGKDGLVIKFEDPRDWPLSQSKLAEVRRIAAIFPEAYVEARGAPKSER